jgi:hypothetical protein
MFKTIEIGAWYRIHLAGKNVFAKALDRHRGSYTFRYADQKGKARTAKVGRSDIFGRLGEHLIAGLESAISPVKHGRMPEPKTKTTTREDRPTTAKSQRPVPEPRKTEPRPHKAQPGRRKKKPSNGQKRLFPE